MYYAKIAWTIELDDPSQPADQQVRAVSEMLKRDTTPVPEDMAAAFEQRRQTGNVVTLGGVEFRSRYVVRATPTIETLSVHDFR